MSKYKNINRTPLFFGDEQQPLFGWYHSHDEVKKSLVMLICPPVGFEYVHSHRSLRHLADNFAQAGMPCLRFDYYGIGDSSGVDEDPNRVNAWLDSIKLAIHEARKVSGCSRIGLVGFRLGATFAAMIAAQEELACLVLWAPCLRGRNYCREMKALRMVGTHNQSTTKNNKNIEGGGFVITEQTIDSLGEIDLHKIFPIPTKIFVLMRDDLAEVTQKLDQWIEHGLDVEYAKFSGYGDIVAEPHYTKIPLVAIKEIVSWVEKNVDVDYLEHNSTSSNYLDSAVITSTANEHRTQKYGEVKIREKIFRFGHQNKLFGILSEPVTSNKMEGPIIILANAGSVHHVGPNRLYIMIVRNLARAGFRCLRMDLSGLGDSFITSIEKENDSYVSSSSDDIARAITALRDKATHFVVMGLCSGAHAAFHAGLDLDEDPISECFLINPLTFYWKDGMSLDAPPSVHNRWHYYKKTMRQKQRWLKLFRGQVNFKAIIATTLEKMLSTIRNRIHLVFSLVKLNTRRGDNLNADVLKICASKRRLTFIFSTTDPGFDILMADAKNAVNKQRKKKNINIEFIENADHTFTTSSHRVELIDKVVNHFVAHYK